MLEDILSAIPLGFLLSFMLGPVFFVLLETSVVKGFRAAFVFDLGVVLGDIVFILISYFSSVRLIHSIKDDPALFIFGGLIMVTYGIISFIKSKKVSKNFDDEDAAELAKNNYLTIFIKGFFLNFINIGVLGFWLAIILTIGPQLQLEPSRMCTFFATVLLTYLVTDVFKILAAKKLLSKMNPKNIQFIRKLINIVLIISGLFLLSQGWFPKEQKLVGKALETLEKHK